MRVDKRRSDVDECKPAKNSLRVSEAACIGGKTVDSMNLNKIARSERTSSGIRCGKDDKRRVDVVSFESSDTEYDALNIGPTRSLSIRVWRVRTGSCRACKRDRAM